MVRTTTVILAKVLSAALGQISKMILRLITCLLLASLYDASSLSAHEVHGSAATITIEGNKLEILQTMPIGTTQEVAKSLVKLAEPSYNNLLTAVAKGWQVSSDEENCQLKKQAYRLVHDDSELQLRYLFICLAGAPPQKLALPWLMFTPEDHFLTLTMINEGKSKTVIFQRQALTINLQE